MTSNTTMTRRRLLRDASVLIGSVPLLGVATACAAKDEPSGLRAVHRFMLGSMRITVIDDARFTFPVESFAANQPPGTIEPFLESFGLPVDFASLHMQVTLIETAGRKVLIDTGMGDVTFPGNEIDNGRLLAGLASFALTADDITDVIISHGHPDHIGSCSHDGVPVFRNAIYHMSPVEYEFWTQRPGTEADFASFMLAVGNAQLEPVRELIRHYKSGDEIIPGITAVAAPGHTLDHHAFLLHDDGHGLLHLMDTAVHYLVGLEQPDWALAVEMDPELAAETRRTLLSRASDRQQLVAGYHFPFPGVGRLVEHEAGWRFVPVQTA